MTTINPSNLTEAATAVTKYCKEHSKGKAKQGTVREALSQFMGFRDSNVALATSGEASNTPQKMFAVVSTYDVSAYDYSELDDNHEGRSTSVTLAATIEDATPVVLDMLEEGLGHMNPIMIDTDTFISTDVSMPEELLSLVRENDELIFDLVRPLLMQMDAYDLALITTELSEGETVTITEVEIPVVTPIPDGRNPDKLHGFIEELEGGITAYLLPKVLSQLVMYMVNHEPSMGQDDEDWADNEERGYDADITQTMREVLRNNRNSTLPKPTHEITYMHEVVGLTMSEEKARWIEGKLEAMRKHNALAWLEKLQDPPINLKAVAELAGMSYKVNYDSCSPEEKVEWLGKLLSRLERGGFAPDFIPSHDYSYSNLALVISQLKRLIEMYGDKALPDDVL